MPENGLRGAVPFATADPEAKNNIQESAKREASNHFRSIGELTNRIIRDLAAKRGMDGARALIGDKFATMPLTVVTSTDEEPAA